MPRIVIVGEAWGAPEEEEGRPFVGPSGRLLKSLLHQVGIPLTDCLLTNVFNLKPAKDVFTSFTGPRHEGIPNMPAVDRGRYIRNEFLPELQRLYKEILDVRPNLILALGATACWAVLSSTGIKKQRGTTTLSRTLPRAIKVLPTYHPAAILREFSLRPVLLADLAKAKRECSFPEVRRPRREIWINPVLSDLWEFERQHITPSPRCNLSIDVETMADRITCFGVAPSPSVALVVPLIRKGPTPSPYWNSQEDEVEALRFMQHICALPNAKLGQNFLYDTKFLWERYGMPPLNFSDDSMLLHHALQPEMEKGLGFLATIYTDEASWKFMRQKDTIKTQD